MSTCRHNQPFNWKIFFTVNLVLNDDFRIHFQKFYFQVLKQIRLNEKFIKSSIWN